MGKPDIVYECHEAEVAYRLRPNPDAETGIGYRYGAVIDWADEPQKWQDNFFIAPEAMEALGLALLEAAKDVKK